MAKKTPGKQFAGFQDPAARKQPPSLQLAGLLSHWEWETHPEYVWGGGGEGFAADPVKAFQQAMADLKSQLAGDPLGPYELEENVEPNSVTLLLYNQRDQLVAYIRVDRSTVEDQAVLAGARAGGPAEANPDWSRWKSEAKRRGKRARKRARRGAEYGYKHAKRGAERGAKETARAARYSADMATWKAKEQQAAHRARNLAKCASALGYGDHPPALGGETIRSARAAVSRVRRQRPQFANYNPRALENWAKAAQIAIQLGVPIVKKVGTRRWDILMSMTVEERTDWLLNTARKTSWLGGPAGRLSFGVWPDKLQRRVFRAVAEAMVRPDVQAATLKAAKLGGAAAQAKYGTAQTAALSRQIAAANPPVIDEPRDLREQISWRVVSEGSRPDLEEEIFWRGPTKQPFLALWAQGWRKYKARHPWGERVMVLHFWMSPGGQRDHIKIKNSPLDQGAVPLKNPRKGRR